MDEIAFMKSTGFKELPKEDYKPLALSIVNRMIDEAILLQLAEKDGLKPSKELVKQEINTFLDQLSPEEKKSFEKSLKTKKTTKQAYIDKMCNNKEAQTGLTVHKWVEMKFGKNLTVTPEEIKAYYQKNKEEFNTGAVDVSHILVEIKEKDPAKLKAATDKAKATADNIYQKLKAGADFKKMAKEKSDCESGKETDGYLGPIAPGQLKDDFKHLEKTLFSLKPGEISTPQKSPAGYHIIKVDDCVFEELPDAEPYIRNVLISQKRDKQVKDLLTKKRNELGVKINIQ